MNHPFAYCKIGMWFTWGGDTFLTWWKDPFFHKANMFELFFGGQNLNNLLHFSLLIFQNETKNIIRD